MNLILADDDETFFKQMWITLGIDEILKEDFIYRISLRINLPYRPSILNKRIKNAVEKGILVLTGNYLKLNNQIRAEIEKEKKSINSKFIRTFPLQIMSDRIEDNIDIWKYGETTESQSIESENSKTDSEPRSESVNYIRLIKKVFDEDEYHRGSAVSNDKIHYIKIDEGSGLIDVIVDGSKDEKYTMRIYIPQKKIVHNCDDFVRNHLRNNTFCKHFFKTIFLLKDKNISLGTAFLTSIEKERKLWQFTQTE
jgi:hypothetical protein